MLEERKAASMILEVKIEDDIAAESAVAAEGASNGALSKSFLL